MLTLTGNLLGSNILESGSYSNWDNPTHTFNWNEGDHECATGESHARFKCSPWSL